MGSVVQYRDLPGGPTKLRLFIELNRLCLCTNCGMLSMSMMQDQNEHMFCETCLVERSVKYRSEHIYCKYEKKEVSIFEMYDAYDLITAIRDLYVFCPNPKCKIHVLLQDLKEHYIQCKQTVTCSDCEREVEPKEWWKHECCHGRGACQTPAKEGPQREVRLKPALLPLKSESAQARSNRNYGETSRSVYRSNDLPQAQGAMPKQARPSDAPSLPNQSQPVQMDSNQNSRQTVRPLYSSSPLQQAQGCPQRPTIHDVDQHRVCPYCGRKVKERNLGMHMKNCSQGPVLCIYCNEKFVRGKVKSHVGQCEKNPDNIREQVLGKSKEAPITLGTRPPQASCGETSIYEDVAPPRMPAGRSTGTSATPHSVNEMTTEGEAENTRFSPNDSFRSV